MSIPKVGDIAPDFEILTDTDELFRLSDLRGKRVVLFFYPGADTPTCTKEACAFRDDFSVYGEKDAVIVGISPDTVRAQSKFKKKFDLPYSLLADDDHKIAEMYGVWGWKKTFGREYQGVKRTTFIIDELGVINEVFEDVVTKGHSAEILSILP
jgi:peroxiredoxin Q/BCP